MRSKKTKKQNKKNKLWSILFVIGFYVVVVVVLATFCLMIYDGYLSYNQSKEASHNNIINIVSTDAHLLNSNSHYNLYRFYNAANQDEVFVVDTDTGQELWRHNFSNSIAGQADGQIVADRVYITSTQEDVMNGNMRGFGSLFCFDLYSGQMLWSQLNIAGAFSHFEVVDGEVFVASHSYIIPFGLTGQEASAEEHAALMAEIEKMRSGKDIVWAFDAISGNVIWRYDVPRYYNDIELYGNWINIRMNYERSDDDIAIWLDSGELMD